MNDVMKYRERIPKYVFKGSRMNRSSIMKHQWVTRIIGIASILFSMDLISSTSPGENDLVRPILFILIFIGGILLFALSEIDIQKELDGSKRMVIDGDRISVPLRLRYRVFGKDSFVLRNNVDHIEIIRGEGNQYIGKWNGVRWYDSPIAFKIVMKNGKKYHSGYKPPNTVYEITNFLKDRWSILIVDKGKTLGRGKRYIDRRTIIGDYSYEEIMDLNFFEWQE